MKILHVISSGGMYGAEAVILDLSRALRREGHSSEIAIFVNSALPNAELETRARTLGIATHRVPCDGQFDRSVPARLRELVKNASFDVVHSHGYKGDVYTFWAMRGSGVPLVATCHNWIDGDLAVRFYGRLDRFVLKRFAAVVAVSSGVGQRLLAAGMSPLKVRSIGNGVDLEDLARIERPRTTNPAGPLTVGIAARLSSEKGVDVFLRAAALIAQQVPQARFLVAGEGPERSSLESLMDALQLRDRVTLLGRQDDMPGFYSRLDLFVLSSRIEGLPMALLEAMASGLAVVATAVGEVPQVVEEERTGHVVGVGDAVALSAAAIPLLRDPARLCRMGAAARERVQAKYAAGRMAAEYLALYRQVCSEAGTSTGDGSV